MSQPIYLVDAFASGPFTGNPAGVCPLEADMPSGWMQDVAAEMNQAETAFSVPIEGGYRLRWFTPTTEVELCGHATLATAHVLWSTGRVPTESLCRFETLSGMLTASRAGDSIELDFPAEPAVEIEAPPDLCVALSLTSEPLAVGQNRMDYIVEIEDEQELRALRPDFQLLAAFPVRGAIVTAKSQDPRYDIVSRFFAPAAGVAEDAATGSAHCCLSPYWSSKLGQNPLRAYQASKRGGSLEVELAGDRVLLRGKALTVFEGALRC